SLNPPNHGTVGGSVSGGDPLPAPSDRTAGAWGSPRITWRTNVTSKPRSPNVGWGGTPASITRKRHPRPGTLTSGIPTVYKGHGVSSGVVLAHGGTTNGVAVAMTAPAASTIGGTVSLAAGVSLLYKDLTLDFADGASIAVGTDLGAATAFNY